MKRMLLVLLISACAWAGWEREALLAFPGVLSAYSAKEYCSCRYVMAFPAEYCRGYVQQYLPLSTLRDEPSLHLVSATGLGRSNRATWEGPRQGCRLLP
ncbi:amidase [Pseudomonas defluvii]|uniref:amidase n=1 Tax=Pseudomonas defluvii TaxID=1876757 RepID=UPI00081184A8|nr:amidase [Pseudomonas defluvii]